MEMILAHRRRLERDANRLMTNYFLAMAIVVSLVVGSLA
jgi:hypothetical protein